MRFGLTCLMALALCFAPAFGQRAAGGGTVTGHVFCADTNAPARMVTVMLQAAAAVDALRSEKPKEMDSEAQAVQTLLDGSFSIRNVAPGTYYVIASAPGYISPLNTLLQTKDDPSADDATKARLAALIPRITVQANLPASANITLERGGAVNGTVLYDDGSPAGGLSVRLLVHRNDKWVQAPSVSFSQAVTSATTDDRGNYRISGLPDQQYITEVKLELSSWIYKSYAHGGSAASSNYVYSLPVYSGNKMRAKDAKPFDLKQGEERAEEDIQIPISKLHSVRGTVTAAHDGHVLNGGKVSLRYPDDKSQVSETSLTSEAEFDFTFVPEGDYLLHVDGASDTEYKEIPNSPGSVPPTHTDSHVLRSYGTAEIPIHVSNDMTNVVVAVPDQQKATSGN
jgi:Carboxypeptidase regulatory-like domain